MKLKFHLQKLEKNLIFQILDQKDIPVGIHRAYTFDDVNISIYSISAPAITIGPKSYFFKGGSILKICPDIISGLCRNRYLFKR